MGGRQDVNHANHVIGNLILENPKPKPPHFCKSCKLYIFLLPTSTIQTPSCFPPQSSHRTVCSLLSFPYLYYYSSWSELLLFSTHIFPPTPPITIILFYFSSSSSFFLVQAVVWLKWQIWVCILSTISAILFVWV